MKRIITVLSLALSVPTVFAQGLVRFANTPTTLVSAGPAGQNVIISGPPGSYYFGLLFALPGTVDPSQFGFSGVYATNTDTPGRIGPDSFAPAVPGWAEGATMSFLVAGWSSSLGHDWNQKWMTGNFDAVGFFGLSSIGTGMAGGPSGGVPAPALFLFGPVGGTSITTGWNLNSVPEPSATALLGLGAATLMLRWRATGRLRMTASG